MPNLRPIALAAFITLGAIAPETFSQSGSYTQPRGSGTSRPATPSGSAQGYGSTTRPRVDAELAMRGYCPVCLVEGKAWVAGDPRLATVFDGKAYYFPDAKRRQQFVADPLKYAPALGGDNIVLYAETGRREPGDLSRGITHQGRVYFVGTQAERDRFNANPNRYANVDLALGGNCVVCRVEMRQNVPGEEKLTSVFGGIRYQFANAQQQRRFAADPARYAKAAAELATAPPATAAPRSTPPGSGSYGSGSR
ncbi:MAG: hypothetical protein AAGJ46_11355 [Planctomycetota bacterium]